MKRSDIRIRIGCISKKFFLRLLLIYVVSFLFSFGGRCDISIVAGEKHTNNSREKIYLHVDKDYYNAGEDIWFAVYLIDAYTHKSETQSRIVYVELIDLSNQIVASRMIRIDDGCGEGDFVLPVSLVKGEYTVRAYTNFMRNFDEDWFFRKRVFVNAIRLNNPDNQVDTLAKLVGEKIGNDLTDAKPDLQFFPEGGYMVDDILNQIAFKFLGTDGKGIDISGTIVDDSGNQLMGFESTKFGLGMFKFVPRRDKNYKANIVWNGRVFTYNLPVSLSQGVTMQIIEQKDSYRVIVHSTLPIGVNGFKFIARQKSKDSGSSEIVSSLDGAVIKVPKNILDEGIAQFTLFDNKGDPLSERLVFVEKNEPGLNVTVSPSKKEYGKRELVELKISWDESGQQYPKANTSIAVTELPATENDCNGLDIKSYLLLSSDIRGEIEQPGYYFNSDDPQREKVQDLLMMTQGWRQFILNDTLNENSSELKFHHETGFRLEGNVKYISGLGNPVKAMVSLTYSNKKEMVNYQTATDESGHFAFEDFDFMDTTSIIVQSKRFSNKTDKTEDDKYPNANLFIVMDSLSGPKVSGIKNIRPSNEIFNDDYPKSNFTPEEIDSIFSAQKGNILIQSVTVTANKIDRIREKRMRNFYLQPSNSLEIEGNKDLIAYPNVLTAMQGRIAGVEINGEDVTIRGRGPPLFLLDGIPVSESAILALSMSEVHFIDLLKGSMTVIYGAAGANGVIAVYTLTASDRLNNKDKRQGKGTVRFVHPGYSQVRKFYEPKYTTGKPVVDKPDKRSTLYWNPNVKLEKKGNKIVSFYTADVPFAYKVILEGISSAGEIIKSETFFNVK